MKSLYFCTLYFLISFTSTIIYATDTCVKQTPCRCVLSAGRVIDLSSVGKVGHPRFYEVPSGNENDTKLYSYNPCHGFDIMDPNAITKPENKPCKRAAACVRTPGKSDGEPPEEHAIGLQAEGKFGNVTNFGFHINYTVPGGTQKLMVLLTCKNGTDTLTVENPEIGDNSLTVMRLESECACLNRCASSEPAAPDGGLSTGSKLLIAFFTILLAYFVVGLVWNFFNGAHGSELVPNYEFWNDLPKLVVEGLIFTCTCFGYRSTYGEV